MVDVLGEAVPEDNGGERLRREKDRTVDQNLRFTTTVTFIVSMVGIAAAAVRMYSVIDNRLTDVETFSERTRVRQDTYIDRNDATHGAMDDAMDRRQDEMQMLREYLTVKFDEMLP